MEIVFATSNKHKVLEVKEILKPYGIDVLGLFDIGVKSIDVEENGKTFKENALIKARAVSHYNVYPIIADDSGLEVDFLNKEPGIKTARFAKEKGGHIEAMQDIMKRINGHDRKARFVCDIALIYKGKERVFEGVCDGKIANMISGSNGFGYDPFFIPDGYDKTFSELGEETKNKISHRGRALRKLAEYLKEQTATL
ncbi:MAG: RdgB/HAM1 family non-canonical purine NTP pyrophosphatase [Erysipelotrichaceae bacterium]|nr:RdgB/HAM1 family non-canonical purine NTP pyrophosphatase [Erysipelotrichaceae bacterium]